MSTRERRKQNPYRWLRRPFKLLLLGAMFALVSAHPFYALAGEILSCTIHGDCSDSNACTEDRCVDEFCTYDPIPGCVPCEPQNICPPLEIVFIMDTSGSMADEAAALCNSIDKIVTELSMDGTEVIAHFLGITNDGGSSFPCITNDVVSLLGSEIPGGDAGCPFPDHTSSYESWGPATSIVADRFAWDTRSIRIIIPISDEGPCNGSRPDGCNDPGDDRDTIDQAIQFSVANNIVVSPITGTGSIECVLSLAGLIATETGGMTETTASASADLPPSIMKILLAHCDQDNTCDDINECTDADMCMDGVCKGVVNFDDDFFCCNPENRVFTWLSDDLDCTQDICDELTGMVTHSLVNDGTICDDVNTCTDNDICTKGVCAGTHNFDDLLFCCRPEDRNLTSLDDLDGCTEDICDETSGMVSHPVAPAGTSCDDAEICTTQDTCDGAAQCNGTDINTLMCEMDSECPEGRCDVENGLCVCGNNTPELRLRALPPPMAEDTCYPVGQDVMVYVELGFSTQLIVGGIFIIEYDPEILSFVSASPGSAVDSESAFSLELVQVIDEYAGLIIYSVGIKIGTQAEPGPATMAAIRFETLASCSSTSLCFTDAGIIKTVLSDDEGSSVPITPFCTSEINILADEPIIQCPESIETNADAGFTRASVMWDPVKATSSCGEPITPVCTATNNLGENIDHLIETGGIVPGGVSEFTCSVADLCGQSDTCSWTVTVHPVNIIEVDVELSAIISDAQQPLSRCIEFELFYPCPFGSIIVEKNIDFGLPYNFTGSARKVQFEIPAGTYSCAMARDPKHTLRSKSNLEIVDGIYKARFTGDPILNGNWLINGNLNEDNVIDIVDFGVLLSLEGMSLNPHTLCGLIEPHADINGDGIVDDMDKDFVLTNFLMADTSSCCITTTTTSVSESITRISFDELERMGLYGLEKYDVNGDGFLSYDDLEGYIYFDPNIRRSNTRHRNDTK